MGAAKREWATESGKAQFVTPEQLGALAVFLSSPAADQVRGVRVVAAVGPVSGATVDAIAVPVGLLRAGFGLTVRENADAITINS